MTDLLLPPDDGPAILMYDIETAPALAWVWGAYDQNIIDVEQDWYLLSFAFKWLGSKKIQFVSIFQDPKFKADTNVDRFVALRLWELFDMADVLVAHNGDKFDKRKSNARFLANNLPPPSPYQTIDTLKWSRKYFAETKHSLAFLGDHHGHGEKVPHQGFALWRDCMRGDPKAWKMMEKYNKQDVALLEKEYLHLRGWAAGPNFGHWDNESRPVCSHCGDPRVIKRGTRRTAVSEFQTWQCRNCQGYSSSRKRDPQSYGGVELKP